MFRYAFLALFLFVSSALAGSAPYSFETLKFSSADGERNYRVIVGVPSSVAPSEGYPVLYALDGNAAFADFSEGIQKRLAEEGAPVVVFIGYETEERFDVDSRAYDYTPPADDGRPFPDALKKSRMNGGAAHYFELIEKQIKPSVEKLASIDKTKQTLWGHSYGGLFVLYVLTSSPASFQAYASADPSLWWNGGAVLRESEAFAAALYEFKDLKLLIMKSGLERKRPERSEGEHAKAYDARVKAVSSVPADAAKTAAYRFASVKGISVQYREYPQLSHGPLLPVSFYAALRLAQGYMD
ncbi:alpha/beta hydrolase [Geovibrio thiophilus]|uniref:Alpha/beta hydrolase n=1 Tax=Geovibrio thiophilus TaxID=139438 RepID=A0A3R5XVG4_9BACT|nr:alpha/beta hydrolase-fold protein [Geovibrio thiophilus]QAR32118.1 alpha/beta hydrolase [Geovibrio thiophilus]